MPVFSKGRRTQVIREVDIDRSTNFHEQPLETIRHAYGKASFFESHYTELSAIMRASHGYLVDLTTVLIDWLRQRLGVATPQYRQLFAGEFMPYLSVIDVLLNEGENSPSIIWSGRGLPSSPSSMLYHNP